MKKVSINAGKSYPDIIGHGLLSKTGEIISAGKGYNKAFIVSDKTVFGLYGQAVKDSLDGAGIEAFVYLFSPGEGSKNLKIYNEIIDEMARSGIDRSDVLIALGGGVTGDIGGFCASTYMRGIDLVLLPTTLLSAADSSVGGKNGVNTAAGKNMAGTFYQPELIICDTDTLRTLPRENYLEGCAEIIKTAIISSKVLFKNLDIEYIKENEEYVISECVRIKGDIVSRDVSDRTERMKLNFGHTAAHAIEKLSGYSVSHGSALAIGMELISKASMMEGFCKDETYISIHDKLISFGFDLKCPFNHKELTEAIKNDKKKADDTITVIVPESLGCCKAVKMDICELEGFFRNGTDE